MAPIKHDIKDISGPVPCTRNKLFSLSVVSDSLWPHGLQDTRPSLSFTISRSWLKHMSIESLMSCNHLIFCHPLLFLPSTFPSIRNFPMSQFFISHGQSIGVSASASLIPTNIQDWFPLRWTGWIYLQLKGLSIVLSNTTVQKHQFISGLSVLFHWSIFLSLCQYHTVLMTVAV